MRSPPRPATTVVRALLQLRRGRLSAAELCDALGVHWRTGYRTLADLRLVVPIRQTKVRGSGVDREPPLYWITRADLSRAIAALARTEAA